VVFIVFHFIDITIPILHCKTINIKRNINKLSRLCCLMRLVLLYAVWSSALFFFSFLIFASLLWKGSSWFRGHDLIVVGYTTTYALRLWWGVLNTAVCDKVCEWLAGGGWWFSPSHPVYSTYKTDRHVITAILLKVVLNTITPCPFLFM
jgi:hypothetical protein